MGENKIYFYLLNNTYGHSYLKVPTTFDSYCPCEPVWPDWAIYWTLGNFSKPFATINLPKSPTFLGNFSKGVKTFNFLVKSFCEWL